MASKLCTFKTIINFIFFLYSVVTHFSLFFFTINLRKMINWQKIKRSNNETDVEASIKFAIGNKNTYKKVYLLSK